MNTNFQLQSSAFAPALNRAGEKTSPPVARDEATPPTTTPAEVFTPSVSRKAPRAGSDMAQMLEDMEANGVLPKAETSVAQVEETKPELREPRSEYMQMMVDSVRAEQALGSNLVQVAVNNNGSIALLDDSQFSNVSHGDVAPQEIQPGKQKPHGSEEHGHEAGHGHGYEGDALMAGHLGTEVVEKVAHAAHHGAGHATSEVASHAGEAIGHATSEKAAGLGSHLSEVASHAAEASAETTGATAAGLHVGKEAAHHLSTAMEAALQVGTVGAGLLAIPLTINGVKELNAGMKENDTEKKLEGVGGIAVGLRSGATATVMGGMLAGAETLTTVAGVASAGLGVVHAGVDTVLGIRDLKHGKKTEGLIKIGTGVAVAAAAIAGGLPLTLTTVAMLGVKVGHKIYQARQEKKAAAQAAQQQQQVPGGDSAPHGGEAVTSTPETQAFSAETKP